MGTGIIVGMEPRTRRICTSPIEKVRDFSYSYSFSVNMRIVHQNGNKFK